MYTTDNTIFFSEFQEDSLNPLNIYNDVVNYGYMIQPRKPFEESSQKDYFNYIINRIEERYHKNQDKITRIIIKIEDDKYKWFNISFFKKYTNCKTIYYQVDENVQNLSNIDDVKTD